MMASRVFSHLAKQTLARSARSSRLQATVAARSHAPVVAVGFRCLSQSGGSSEDKKMVTEVVKSKAEPTKEVREKHSWLLKLLGFYGKETTLIRHGDRMYRQCQQQSENETWLNVFGVENSFIGKYQVTALHVWLCLVALRRLPEGKLKRQGKKLQQSMFDAFWDDYVDRIRAEPEVRSMMVSKYHRELQDMFFAAGVSYDKALAAGGNQLSEALVKNFFSGASTDEEVLSRLMEYVQINLERLQSLPIDDLMEGKVTWDHSLLRK